MSIWFGQNFMHETEKCQKTIRSKPYATPAFSVSGLLCNRLKRWQKHGGCNCASMRLETGVIKWMEGLFDREIACWLE